jgi:hypothetical protein
MNKEKRVKRVPKNKKYFWEIISPLKRSETEPAVQLRSAPILPLTKGMWGKRGVPKNTRYFWGLNSALLHYYR